MVEECNKRCAKAKQTLEPMDKNWQYTYYVLCSLCTLWSRPTKKQRSEAKLEASCTKLSYQAHDIVNLKSLLCRNFLSIAYAVFLIPKIVWYNAASARSGSTSPALDWMRMPPYLENGTVQFAPIANRSRRSHIVVVVKLSYSNFLLYDFSY